MLAASPIHTEVKKTIVVTIAAWLAASALTVAAVPAGDASEIIHAEKSAWEAFKNHDGDALTRVTAPGYVSVSPGGFSDLKAELKDVKRMRLDSYSLIDTTVRPFHPNLVVLTYRARIRASLNGKNISGTMNCATIYEKQNGRWVSFLHSEAKAEH